MRTTIHIRVLSILAICISIFDVTNAIAGEKPKGQAPKAAQHQTQQHQYQKDWLLLIECNTGCAADKDRQLDAFIDRLKLPARPDLTPEAKVAWLTVIVLPQNPQLDIAWYNKGIGFAQTPGKERLANILVGAANKDRAALMELFTVGYRSQTGLTSLASWIKQFTTAEIYRLATMENPDSIAEKAMSTWDYWNADWMHEMRDRQQLLGKAPFIQGLQDTLKKR